MVDFNLYLITDRFQTAGRTLPAVVADALRGGLKAVQLRDKDLPPCQLFELAGELRALTRSFGARLLINDRIDIAQAVEADGVHLGKAGIPVAAARRLLGMGKLIGYSAHDLEEARRAAFEGADFVTFGPVYATPSKMVYGPPSGLAPLADAARTLSVPVFALGGVKKTSAADVMATGAHGIAVISAVIAAENPCTETEALLRCIENYDASA